MRAVGLLGDDGLLDRTDGRLVDLTREHGGGVAVAVAPKRHEHVALDAPVELAEGRGEARSGGLVGHDRTALALGALQALEPLDEARRCQAARRRQRQAQVVDHEGALEGVGMELKPELIRFEPLRRPRAQALVEDQRPPQLSRRLSPRWLG